LLRARDRGEPEQAAAIERMERAVESLRAFSEVLLRYEAAHRWRPGDESLDAAAGRRAAGGPGPEALSESSLARQIFYKRLTTR
jgi:hypothetical protein